MDNKLANKQIPIKTIIDVAKILESYKDEYIVKFENDEKKNKD